MPKLFAEFTIEVSSPCLVAWPEGQMPQIAFDSEGFHVEVAFEVATHWGVKHADDENWTTAVDAFMVLLSRDEPDTPPDPILEPDGQSNYAAQGSYLRSKLPDYQAVAHTTVDNILRFFQYSLSTPLVRRVSRWDHGLSNPTWYDSNRKELRGGTHTVIMQPVPGLHGELGAKKLCPTDLPALTEFLMKPTEPSLVQTLISDAQTAWFDGHLRRAVLELAICTEILVKRKFFAEASPAGAAFDYLEDKAKVSIRVLELIDAVAAEAFSCSFKRHNLGNFHKIDYLFRCRNKIAHRGELSYRDDSGTTVAVDASIVKGWWHAVTDLKSWIEGL
jgi:hypothetical protein